MATSQTLIAETSARSAWSMARRALVVSRFGSLARPFCASFPPRWSWVAAAGLKLS
jgi:hypothetical protein